MFKNKRISSAAVFFFISILIGSFILKLPVCTKNGINFIDAIYESASAITSTGATTLNISESFTTFGQIILLLLIQLGTIGFLSLYALIFLVHKKRIKLSSAITLSSETNVSNYSVIKKETLKIVYFTLIIELLGSFLLAFKFVPIYGISKGIWYSVFHSISAYCNVGFDIIGPNSFIEYGNDLYFNIVMIILMFLGSIGYFVLKDLWKFVISRKNNKIGVQSKFILKATFLIVTIGVVLIKIFNPGLNILESIFTIMTSRSTGFYTIDMNNLSEISKAILTFVMFIGGSPASNAGGIRVVVLATLVLTTISDLKNDEEIVISYRSINSKTVRRALTIFIVDSIIVIFGIILLSITENISIVDLNFYAVSTFSTTGLSTFDPATLSVFGKYVSIFIMYLGRIAPITFLALFVRPSKTGTSIKYPNMDIIL